LLQPLNLALIVAGVVAILYAVICFGDARRTYRAVLMRHPWDSTPAIIYRDRVRRAAGRAAIGLGVVATGILLSRMPTHPELVIAQAVKIVVLLGLAWGAWTDHRTRHRLREK